MKALLYSISLNICNPRNARFSHGTGWAYIVWRRLQEMGYDIDIALGADWNKGKYDLSQYDQAFLLGNYVPCGGFPGGDGCRSGFYEAIVQTATTNTPVARVGKPLSKKFINTLCCRKTSCWADFPYFKEIESKYWEAEENAIDIHVGAKTLVYGDSHAQSQWQPNSYVVTREAKTLYGAINSGFWSFEELPTLTQFDKITLIWGNIDARHHLTRQTFPTIAAEELAERYVAAALEAPVPHVELVELFPFPSDSRPISNGAKYKGQPFHGDFVLRSHIVEIFNRRLHNLASYSDKLSVYTHPSNFYEKANQLSTEVMERPRSVHIAPLWYRGDLFGDRDK